MPGLGTIVNVAAVIAGGLIGLLFGKKINENIRVALMKVLGIAVIFVGITGALSGLLVIVNGKITTYGTLMMIISLVVGTLIGELLKIESYLEKFGNWLKRKVDKKGDNGFVSAFVNTSLVICVGAMAVVGSIQDGISADHSVLFAKALLDFLIVIIMSSTLGFGSLFAFIPIGVFQGTLTAAAKLCEPLFAIGNVTGDLSLVGSVMIFCVGYNIAFGKKFNVGNMLPGLIVAVIYSLLTFYFGG